MGDFYLQVDLDAIKRSVPLARAGGITQPEAIGGLITMWECCWYSKSDRVTRVAILGFFGGDPIRVAPALETFGFLEKTDDADTWRVKGARDRILRVKKQATAAQSKGGKAAIGNLQQFQKPAKKPKDQQTDLINGEPTKQATPKERAPSIWEETWDLMQALAEGYADEHAIVKFEREEIPPAQINTRLKRACESLDITADELVDIWQECWLPNEWAQGREPVYALSAFLSSKTLPNYHREWLKNSADLAEYDRQVAAGIVPRDPSGYA